jgi:hypothetical protein
LEIHAGRSKVSTLAKSKKTIIQKIHQPMQRIDSQRYSQKGWIPGMMPHLARWLQDLSSLVSWFNSGWDDWIGIIGSKLSL